VKYNGGLEWLSSVKSLDKSRHEKSGTISARHHLENRVQKLEKDVVESYTGTEKNAGAPHRLWLQNCVCMDRREWTKGLLMLYG
jgi:hypothetical protein